jgi:hypothetical protein
MFSRNVTRPPPATGSFTVNHEHDAIRSAYADLLAAADAAYHATDQQQPRRLRQATELIDLLETAMALAATEEHPVGHG